MTKQSLSEILDHIDMEYWLDRESIEYKVVRGKNGEQLNVKECPCCGNSNWKVYLSRDTGLGNCFHGDCEVKFSKWKFIQAFLDGANNKETAEYCSSIAQEQGMKVVKKKEFKQNLAQNIKLPKSIPLPIDGKNLAYLAKRNISLDTAKYFELRYCMNGFNEFISYDGKKARQDFSKRIIIPIRDQDGKIVSYQGRDITGVAEKKYLFPSGFASTGVYLYNAHNAVGYVDVCLAEGVFDVMSIHQCFQKDIALKNVAVCGTFGKHLSFGDENSQFAELIKLKEHGLECITFMWDGEKRAILDAVDTALAVKRLGFRVRVAVLPKDKDPNEISEEELKQCYLKAIEINNITALSFKMKYC